MRDEGARADLHVHSKYSDRPSEWFLRRIGAPESFVEPKDIYWRALRQGMQFVTIADHNSIRGALEIADRPNTFLSAELTTYFPEDGCKVHCLVAGITEAQFQALDEARRNIYDLREYVVRENIFHSIAHPLFRVNNQLTVEHVEKLLLLFNTFEGINGARHARAGELVFVIFRNLTAEVMAELADRHGIVPNGRAPWRKCFTGGSDDHSGLYLGHAYTCTGPVRTVEEYLAELRAGRHEMGGHHGTSLRMAHSIYRIAYDYYRSRFMGSGAGSGAALGALLQRLVEGETSGKRSWFQSLRLLGRRLLGRERTRSAVETLLVQEFSDLVGPEEPEGEAGAVAARAAAAAPVVDEQRAFAFACQIGHQLGYAFVRKFTTHARKGELMESLEALAAMGPLALSIAPYIATFATQHKDEAFLQALARHWPAAGHLAARSEKKAWVTDTFSDINGVARTIQCIGQVAKAKGRSLTVVTCLDKPPKTDINLKNFRPIGTFRLPEYDALSAVFPPFLEILQYFEREKFAEVIISTPGPMGLVALAAGRLLGMRVTGIYHTDFPLYARYLTQDENMEMLAWRYMHWFFGQLDLLFVPSQFYLKLLHENGFNAEKMCILPRGVDVAVFSPQRRDRDFWGRWHVRESFRYLYVGRVSAEKNVGDMLEAFTSVHTALPDTAMVVVGDGPLLPELRRRYAGKGIYFTGYLEGLDVATAYASADVFVFPSTTDTFGNAVLEAQASGLPAIVTHAGGPQEIVRRYQSGIICDTATPAAMAQAMRRLHDDSAFYADLVLRALQNARDSRWEHILEEFWSPALVNPPAAARDQDLRCIRGRGEHAGARSLQVA